MDIDAREWFRRNYPEDECVQAGDPYLARIVQFEEYIAEIWGCRDFYDRTDAEAAAIATNVLEAQRAYEEALLLRWWRLDAPRPP